MTMNQISIFLENKFGRLSEILSILRDENIKVIAATVADTSDYGILRIITTDQQKAFKTLIKNEVSANMNEVLAISLDSRIGQLSDVIEKITKSGITIDYMYCFSLNQKSMLVLRSSNMDALNDVAHKFNMNCISETDLINL
jgi:hypothetical protein